MSKSPAALKAIELVCFALCVANVAYVAVMVVSHDWILNADGRPIPVDFANIYAAGRLALAGNPAGAWDWTVLQEVKNAVAGEESNVYFGWHYPPLFLLIAAALATLPYAIAFVTWIAVTLPLYLATIRTIIGGRLGWLMAGAFPVLLPNVMPGQNGFLTASLFGGSLLFLERRPLLSGVCLGLLTYKPQFGVLFPLVLAVTGQWRVIASATVTFGALSIVTVAAFGWAPWAAFFHWLPLTAENLLSGDGGSWHKFQSLFALVRLFGGNATLAWWLQTLLAVLTALILCVAWRSRGFAYNMKASALAAGALLVSPYVYLYDLTILAVSLAFLLRAAMESGFLPGEKAGLAALAALFVVMPVLELPVGLIGAVITAALITRRSLLLR